MEEITLKKSRVLEAASKCSTAKRTLEILCPEFFGKPKPKFEVGKWYKSTSTENSFVNYQKDEMGFGVWDGVWDGDWGHWVISDSRYWELATPEEIEKALIAEAEKRGYVGKVLAKTGFNEQFCQDFGKVDLFKYYHNDDILDSVGGHGYVYQKGTWAEILPSKKKMTIKEVEKELGYEIEITNA